MNFEVVANSARFTTASLIVKLLVRGFPEGPKFVTQRQRNKSKQATKMMNEGIVSWLFSAANVG